MALANSPSVKKLSHRMDALDKALEPFLLNDRLLATITSKNNDINTDTLARIEFVREKLLAIEPGARLVHHLLPILDEIEQDARVARMLAPQDQAGWVWSWGYDDWFRWDPGEKKWLGAMQGWKVDLLV